MAAGGFNLSYEKLWEGFELPVQGDPTKAKTSASSIPLNGSNYQKPYPPKGGLEALPKPNVELKQME